MKANKDIVEDALNATHAQAEIHCEPALLEVSPDFSPLPTDDFRATNRAHSRLLRITDQ